jgi:L-lactate dehydrogenase complex protein LldG
MSSREQILARVRAALVDVAREESPDGDEAGRGYLEAHATGSPAEIAGLLAENLADYRAAVHRCTSAELPALLARLLREHGSRSVAVPPGLPAGWLEGLDGVEVLTDDGRLTANRLDRVDSVVTGCAVAVAETGTLVLDSGPDQGRRLLTLVPDHHVCVVRPGQVVASVPQAVRLLDPVRPQTWISGPSATSDIELNRVEGVHGPRTLEAVLLSD